MGDVNLDGIVSADDYVVLNANFNEGVGNPLVALASTSVTAVPEPSSLILLFVGATALLYRMRNS